MINNNIIGTAPGQVVFEYDFGPMFHTLAEFEGFFADRVLDNLEVDPGFTDPTGRDYTLQADSAMVDAGRFLTTVVGNGSGTTMTVADARYFYDGFGIPGEMGDLVQLEGESQAMRIVSVDYVSNTLTFAESVTFSAGQGISLAYSGTAPDIGAFER